MNKSTSESFKNTIQSEKYRTLSELLKTVPPPELLKAAVENAQFYSKIAPSPELLKIWNSTMALYKSLDIAQLNHISKQIASLPKTDFQKIKNTVYENRSQIYDAVHDTMETISSNIEQSDQNNNDETLIISEQVAELVNIVDDSSEFPQPDSDKHIHIKKTNKRYQSIINTLHIIIFSVILPFYNTYQNDSTATLLVKNHNEVIQAIDKNHSEEMQALNKIINIWEQALPFLEQIAENTSSNQNKD